MRRATVTLPDDLARALDAYLAAQEAPPGFTAIVQTALRAYLAERGYLPRRRRLSITPAGNPRRGPRDVSLAHDRYLALR